MADLLTKIARADVRRVDEVAPEVKPPLADVVHRALARNPNERFKSARAMRRALLEAVGRAEAPRRKKHKGMPLLPLLVVAGLLGAVVAVSVVVGLTIFIENEEPAAADSSFGEPAAVTPVLNQPPAPTPMAPAGATAIVLPPSLGIPECDAAGQLACRCPRASIRPQLCASTHQAFQRWRELLDGSEHNRSAVESGCRQWNARMRELCLL